MSHWFNHTNILLIIFDNNFLLRFWDFLVINQTELFLSSLDQSVYSLWMNVSFQGWTLWTIFEVYPLLLCAHFWKNWHLEEHAPVPGLGQELVERKLTMLGTVRKIKPELPPTLVSSRGREALSSIFAFPDTHTLVSYVPRKNRKVILMSPPHKDAAT